MRERKQFIRSYMIDVAITEAKFEPGYGCLREQRDWAEQKSISPFDQDHRLGNIYQGAPVSETVTSAGTQAPQRKGFRENGQERRAGGNHVCVR